MNDQKHGIRIVAVSGSMRSGNSTSKALALVIDEFRKHPEIVLRVIDPASMELPLPGTGDGSPPMRTLKAAVAEATGVVLATPEYHGS